MNTNDEIDFICHEQIDFSNLKQVDFTLQKAINEKIDFTEGMSGLNAFHVELDAIVRKHEEGDEIKDDYNLWRPLKHRQNKWRYTDKSRLFVEVRLNRGKTIVIARSSY